MLLCWHNCPEERPTFKELRAILHNILNTKAVRSVELFFMQIVAIFWYFKVCGEVLFLIVFTSFVFILEDLHQR